ncbi:MAG: spore coat protein CotJB [Clostridiales bacterium]|nr:spore coat protein CotJB [Clostridiales bacterium]
MNREKMLREIMALDFAIVDLNLFLDTHPYDDKTVALCNNCIMKSKELKDCYQEMYGPLCVRDYINCGDKWAWIDDPWPWDKYHCYCEEG